MKFSRGENNVFDLPNEKLKLFEQSFPSLFKKFLKEKETNSTNILTSEENKQFQEIIEYVELQTLFVWVKPVIQQIYKDTKKEQNKNAKNRK